MLSLPRFLRAEQVGRLLEVDRSTVYRMAESGQLPAMKVGRQWRFPAEEIERMLEMRGVSPVLSEPEPRSFDALGRGVLRLAVTNAMPLLELAAEILGVMMFVTDMNGEPVGLPVNPCPWFVQSSDDPDLLVACMMDWKILAEDPDFDIRFRPNSLHVDCARAFVRNGPQLVGQVVAGCVALDESDPRALYRLSREGRQRVLASLPMVAARISRLVGSPAPDFDAPELD
jgi:excisionase family DNA binding protein